MEGPGEEQTQNQDYQPAKGRARMPTEQLLWCPSPWSLLQLPPLCPPALPTVSATPGTHMLGNLISLVLPSEDTTGRWGLGGRGGAGSRAPARKWSSSGRAGRAAGPTCCVTLSSLLGLSGLRLLQATWSSGSRVNHRQLVASWAHLLMPGTAHWHPQVPPSPAMLTGCVTPSQCLSFLIMLKGLGLGCPVASLSLLHLGAGHSSPPLPPGLDFPQWPFCVVARGLLFAQLPPPLGPHDKG